jgi:hypothetical protein
VTDNGLHKDLMVDGSNAALCAKMLGERLTAYIEESFTAQTASETIAYKLSKKATHWDGKKSPVQRRYVFEEISRHAREDQGGHVLEEPHATANKIAPILDDPDLNQYHPEKIPG